MDMLEGVFFMQNLISVPVPMTSCRQEAYLQRLRRQFPFVYIRPLTRTAFGRRVWALQLGGGSRKVLVAAGHHANECITSDALWQWLFAYCEALLDGGFFFVCHDGWDWLVMIGYSQKMAYGSSADSGQLVSV